MRGIGGILLGTAAVKKSRELTDEVGGSKEKEELDGGPVEHREWRVMGVEVENKVNWWLEGCQFDDVMAHPSREWRNSRVLETHRQETEDT